MFQEIIEDIHDKYDICDFINRVAALNLVSNNQNKSTFMDTLIEELSSYPANYYSGSYKISAGKFKKVISAVNENTQIRMSIDPNENSFIQRVLYKGNYWVFNGIGATPTYQLQLMLDSLSKREKNYPEKFTNEANKMINVMLEISDGIARKIINSEIGNDEGSEISVPKSSTIQRYYSLVRLPAKKIRESIGVDVFSSIILQFGHELSDDPYNMHVFTHSIMWCEYTDEVIILDVGLLTSFIIYKLIMLADQHSIKEIFLDDFNHQALNDCVMSLQKLGQYPLEMNSLGIKLEDLPNYKELLVSVGNCQLMLVVFICDDGNGYGEKNLYSMDLPFSNDEHFNKRLKAINNSLAKAHYDASEIYVVTIISSIGRGMGLRIYSDNSITKYRVLNFNPFELWCISINEKKRKLFLPRYIRAKTTFHKNSMPSLFSELDSIEMFESCKDSFIFTDEYSIDSVVPYIAPGDGLDYSNRAITAANKKTVNGVLDSTWVSVISEDEIRELFCPEYQMKNVECCYLNLSEDTVKGIWVVTIQQEDLKDFGYLDIIHTAYDMVSYWLSECREYLKQIIPEKCTVFIRINIEGVTDDFRTVNRSKALLEELIVDYTNDGLILHWTPRLTFALVSKDNRKEREFISLLLGHVYQYLESKGRAIISLDEARKLLHTVTDVAFENPLKQKILSRYYGNNPCNVPPQYPVRTVINELDDSNFPHPKGVMHLENSILQTIKKA